MIGFEKAQNIIDIVWLWLPMGLQIGAFFLTLLYGIYLAWQQNLKVVHLFLAGVVGIVGALLGGRLWVELWTSGSIQSFDQLWSGQRGVIGVLLGAACFAGAYLKACRQPVITYADAALPAIVMGYFIARLGCLAAGDDFGIPTNLFWSIYFGPDTEAYQVHLSRGLITSDSNYSLALHPTQVYHGLSAAIVFVVLKSGVITERDLRLIFAMTFYGATRFIIQFFRDDHWPVILQLDSAQIASLGFILVGITLWVIRRYMIVKKLTVVNLIPDRVG